MEWVVITGASSGIGEALALAFAAPNRSLTLVARRTDELQRVGAIAEARGAQVSLITADLAKESETLDLLQGVPIGAEITCIHNAGIGIFGPASELDALSVDSQIAINLRAPMLLNAKLLPHMLAAGRGQIIHVISMAATHTLPYASAYSASKAGLLAYAKSLAAEVRTQGIRVINILPGATSTPIWGESSPPREEMINPTELAELIHQLASSPRTLSTDEVLVMPPKGIL